jgi:hypothetical protein
MDNRIAGWSFNTSSLYNGTDIVLDSANKRITVGNGVGYFGYYSATYPALLSLGTGGAGYVEMGKHASGNGYLGFHDGTRYNIQLGSLQYPFGGTGYGIRALDSSGNQVFKIATDGISIAGWTFDTRTIWGGASEATTPGNAYVQMASQTYGMGANWYNGPATNGQLGFQVVVDTSVDSAYLIQMGQLATSSYAASTSLYGIQMIQDNNSAYPFFRLSVNTNGNEVSNSIAVGSLILKQYIKLLEIINYISHQILQ